MTLKSFPIIILWFFHVDYEEMRTVFILTAEYDTLQGDC